MHLNDVLTALLLDRDTIEALRLGAFSVNEQYVSDPRGDSIARRLHDLAMELQLLQGT